MITTKDFFIPDDYNSFNKRKKQETCRKVVEVFIGKMNTNATQEQRITALGGLLGRSLQENEKLEYYEDCVILRDLLQELRKYANNQSRKTKTNPQDAK